MTPFVREVLLGSLVACAIALPVLLALYFFGLSDVSVPLPWVVAIVLGLISPAVTREYRR